MSGLPRVRDVSGERSLSSSESSQTQRPTLGSLGKHSAGWDASCGWRGNVKADCAGPSGSLGGQSVVSFPVSGWAMALPADSHSSQNSRIWIAACRP